MARTLYTILLWLALPVLGIRLALRAAKNPGYRSRIAERFGWGGGEFKSCELWIHAVSVGEVNAATPLVQSLLQHHPSMRIMITTMTPTGASRVVDTFGSSVVHRYAPYDYPFAIRRFLDRFRPKLLVLMETEIWPNMIAHCHHRHIAIAMANVRLSAKSARGYQMIRPLIQDALQKVSVFAAQSQVDKDNLLSLGVDPMKVLKTGSTKFEIEMAPSVAEVAQAVRRDWGPNRAVVVAGSTHEGEEILLLRVLNRLLQKFPDLLMVIAPRHPERFEAVTRLVAKNGLAFTQRTLHKGPLDSNVAVQIADTMGELPVLYGAADIAVVGGSLIPIRGIGGHNILEPCAVGVPVVFGKNMSNFIEISQLTLAEVAGFQVENEDQLVFTLIRLLEDASLRASVGEHGRDLIKRHAGATEKTLDLILPLIVSQSEAIR